MQYSVVGESFANPDGIERQAIIAKLKEGEVVHLRREPDNLHDRNAIAVMSRYGVIGHLSHDDSRQIARRMDEGYSYEARICFISDTDEDRPLRGVCLNVTEIGMNRDHDAKPPVAALKATSGNGALRGLIVVGALGLLAIYFFNRGTSVADVSSSKTAVPTVDAATEIAPDDVVSEDALNALLKMIQLRGYACEHVVVAKNRGQSAYGIKAEVWCGHGKSAYAAQHYAVYLDRLKVDVCSADLFADCN